ncbi:MAG TPA: hypothetical protein VFI06_18205 [Chitinophagaceae bacterium]|nr:hypothetical protein [Chitinophagaceae bacterium]
MPTKILYLLIIVAICSCTNKPANESIETNKGQAASLTGFPDSVVIAPLYPDTVFFMVEAELGDEIQVKGNVEGFRNRIKTTRELYFQRFVEKQGRFRVIHAVGTGIEDIHEGGKQTHDIKRYNDTIKFDEIGYFAGDPGDPVELIPLYPGHMVSKGQYWMPTAPVKIGLGQGLAKYKFIIDSFYYDEKNTLLARMQIEVNADLEPVAALKGGKVTVSGGGWIIWDCTINQRRETHLKAVYLGTKNNNEVRQIITVDDKLNAHSGKKYF